MDFKKRKQFSKELETIINKLSIDNEIGTNDFIIAEQLTKNVEAMIEAKRQTDRARGIEEEGQVTLDQWIVLHPPAK